MVEMVAVESNLYAPESFRELIAKDRAILGSTGDTLRGTSKDVRYFVQQKYRAETVCKHRREWRAISDECNTNENK